MKTEPRVSIIILNWNGFDDTIECLNSLKNISYRNYEIVLVDNGSGNNEGNRLKTMFPEVHIIQNKVNRGFAGGNNDGMNWALAKGAEYIVNLNNDCIVTGNWLSNLINGMVSSNADFGTSTILFYPDTSLICSDGDVLLPDGGAIPININRIYEAGSGVKPIFSACGAGSIYSKRCLENIKIKGSQFFDELYFAYLEDVDLGIRLNMKAFKGISVQDAVVYHKQARSAGKYSKFLLFQLEKNRLLIELLNYPVFFILIGELFSVLKRISFLILQFYNKKRYGKITWSFEKIGFIGLLIILLKARLWVIANFHAVIKDRLERRCAGLISIKIWKLFYMNLPDLVNSIAR